MLRVIGLVAVALSGAAHAQIASYKTNNPAVVKGDVDKIVCQKEEKIGTRLGAKKVCLTVAEWNEQAQADRERTQRIQSTACLPGEGQACADPSL